MPFLWPNCPFRQKCLFSWSVLCLNCALKQQPQLIRSVFSQNPFCSLLPLAPFQFWEIISSLHFDLLLVHLKHNSHTCLFLLNILHRVWFIPFCFPGLFLVRPQIWDCGFTKSVLVEDCALKRWLLVYRFVLCQEVPQGKGLQLPARLSKSWQRVLGSRPWLSELFLAQWNSQVAATQRTSQSSQEEFKISLKVKISVKNTWLIEILQQ